MAKRSKSQPLSGIELLSSGRCLSLFTYFGNAVRFLHVSGFYVKLIRVKKSV